MPSKCPTHWRGWLSHILTIHLLDCVLQVLTGRDGGRGLLTQSIPSNFSSSNHIIHIQWSVMLAEVGTIVSQACCRISLVAESHVCVYHRLDDASASLVEP